MWQDISEFLHEENFRIDGAGQYCCCCMSALSPLDTAKINGTYQQHACAIEVRCSRDGFHCYV
ncbi:unnamed protein product [Anisakis simplex]|uniref:Antirestriction protein n=1 Tax=Anisakis simplex TaxID=6269 RepID=A0A0M3KKS1_ANISI|nr:unnamed protein product [Anisakis simplex]